MDTRNTDMSSTVTFHMPVKERAAARSPPSVSPAEPENDLFLLHIVSLHQNHLKH